MGTDVPHFRVVQQAGEAAGLEPYRVYRRALSERGWSPCPERASTPRNCVNAPCGWSLIMPTNTPPNGPRSDQSPRRSAAPWKRFGGGYATPNATAVGVRG